SEALQKWPPGIGLRGARTAPVPIGHHQSQGTNHQTRPMLPAQDPGGMRLADVALQPMGGATGGAHQPRPEESPQVSVGRAGTETSGGLLGNAQQGRALEGARAHASRNLGFRAINYEPVLQRSKDKDEEPLRVKDKTRRATPRSPRDRARQLALGWFQARSRVTTGQERQNE